MTDAIVKELAALLALCRGTASVYRKLPASDPVRVAAIVDGLGDRIATLLERK